MKVGFSGASKALLVGAACLGVSMHAAFADPASVGVDPNLQSLVGTGPQLAMNSSPAAVTAQSGPANLQVAQNNPSEAGTSQNTVTAQPPNQAPATGKSAAEEAVYQQQNALFRRGLTITPSYTYSYSDKNTLQLNGFLAFGAIFLGNFNVSRAQTTIHQANLNAVYGLTNRFELSMNVPYLYRYSTFQATGAQGSSQITSQITTTKANIGDVNFGVFYQAVEESGAIPAIILNAQGKAPTGTSPYGIKQIVGVGGNNNLQYPSSLPTGTGVWTAEAGVTAIKTFAPAIVFGSLNFYYNFSRHFSDISTQQNVVEPGTVNPGHTIEVIFGTAFALSNRMSLTFSYTGDYTSQTSLKPDGGASSAVIGSDTTTGVFSAGTTIVVTPNINITTNIGIGVTQDSPGVQLGVSMPIQF